ncbi:unnamed protein product [Moneuplotes crassus]|uniref:Uncharacterized protein n=1 Tax=Euplotes crassus TaxID=5936 RepID=A0AAD1Y3W2_EUPCR|nr:unnamed protein product [Moneuplotes crassus]
MCCSFLGVLGSLGCGKLVDLFCQGFEMFLAKEICCQKKLRGQRNPLFCVGGQVLVRGYQNLGNNMH